MILCIFVWLRENDMPDGENSMDGRLDNISHFLLDAIIILTQSIGPHWHSFVYSFIVVSLYTDIQEGEH